MSKLLTFSLAFSLTLATACKRDEPQPDPSAPVKTTSSAGPAAPSASGKGAVAAAADSVVIVGRAVPVDVGEHGFSPNEVTIKKGEATTLVFTRSSNSTCAFEVVFPDLGITKELPLHQAVAVVVPVDQTRTLGFQCGMGMYKSKVVVM